MQEIEVFKTKFFQRLCEERKKQIVSMMTYRMLFLLTFKKTIHDDCPLPPTFADIYKYNNGFESFKELFKNIIDEVSKFNSPTSALPEVQKVFFCREQEDSLPSFRGIEELDEKEPGCDHVIPGFTRLLKCYEMFQENIREIFDQQTSDESNKWIFLEDKFFEIEKSLREVISIHYRTIAIAASLIKESRKNMPGAKKTSQMKARRKENFRNLIKEMGLYDRERLMDLTGSAGRKTKMTLIEKAKQSCDLLSDKSIQNYLKEILEELSQQQKSQ